MALIRIWEGVRGWNGYLDDYVWHEFEGELVGIWKPADYGDNTCYTYLLEDNTVVFYIHNEKNANVYKYDSLDEAAEAGFDDVLYLMNVVSNHDVIKKWRKTFPYRHDFDEEE